MAKAPKKGHSANHNTERRPRRIRAYELQHREAALLDLLQSYPSKIVNGLAKKPEAGWHLGRLYLIGVLSPEEYYAATYIDKITRAYETMLRRHGQLKATNPEKSDNMTPEDLSISAQKKFARLQKKYDEVYHTLTECGEDVKRAVVDALRKDAKTDVVKLSRGLTIIAITILDVKSRTR